MIREAKEEIGIVLKEKDLKVVYVIHRDSTNGLEYIDFFITVNKYEGNIKNMEKDKCSELKWFSLNNLPLNLLPCIKQAIENYKNKIFFSEA